jgi:hypothetical protein
VLRGRHAAFVRDDELRRAWQIFTPVLHRIKENVQPIVYPQDPEVRRRLMNTLDNSTSAMKIISFSIKEWTARPMGQRKSHHPTPQLPLMPVVSDADKCDIGLWGLAVMGQNFALNMATHGFRVVVGNRSYSKVTTTVERAKAEGDLPIVGAKDVAQFVAHLSKPRKVVILVRSW